MATRESNTSEHFLHCAVALLGIGFPIGIFWQLMYVLPPAVWENEQVSIILSWFPSLWYLSASVLALIRTGRVSSPARKLGVCLITIFCLFLLPYFLGEGYVSLWQKRYNDSEYQASRKRRLLPAQEAVLYAQPKLLAETLEKVAPERPGVTDLYLVAMGGYGSQDVFLREVKSVSTLFAERFGTQDHSIELINNPTTVLTHPIASVTALERTLNTMGARMNPEEDVLFLFMTSHGAEKAFNLQLWPYQFDDLTPERLRQMLDASQIKNRVIVVSACYSGSFIEPLINDDTLVISASRADRNSHGCSHEAEWTFFGQAYFNESLRHTLSFTQAFEEAKQSIARREEAENLDLSEPQMFVGENIVTVLQRLQDRLSAEAQK